jgi:hypothetical protein
MSLVYKGIQCVNFGPHGNYTIHRDGALTKRGKLMSDSVDDGGYVHNSTLSRYDLDTRRHRMIGNYFVQNPRPGYFVVVDHINGIKNENRAENIRWLTNQLNCLNTKSMRITPQPNRKNPYRAQIMFCRMYFYLGWYKTAKEAIDLQNKIREELFDKLYWYETTPWTYVPPPEDWIVSKLGVNMFPGTSVESVAVMSVMTEGMPEKEPITTDDVMWSTTFPGWSDIVKAIQRTHKELHGGFKYKEAHYQKALEHYIHKTIPGIVISKEVQVTYKTTDGFVFGYGRMDLVLETDTQYIIIELKAHINMGQKRDEVKAQLARYMIHADTNKKVRGVIAAFGTRPPMILLGEIGER